MRHIPVLFDEVLELLQPHPDGCYIDGTVGAGGHTTGILNASAPTGRVLGLDKDPEAVRFAGEQLAHFGKRVTLVNASYLAVADIARGHGFLPADGILLDLGLSSRQLDNPERGFSLRQDGPLDMRYDQQQPETAADLINNWDATELADIFWRYGEERRSRHFARIIVEKRPFYTTHQLAGVIAAHAGRQQRRIHPATQVFQALRIAVNRELEAVENGIPQALDCLGLGGRLAVISFHSLEDRFVKQLFRQISKDCTCPPQQPICTCGGKADFRLITRKVVKAGAPEITQNSRSRSARLRVIERIRD